MKLKGKTETVIRKIPLQGRAKDKRPAKPAPPRPCRWSWVNGRLVRMEASEGRGL